MGDRAGAWVAAAIGLAVLAAPAAAEPAVPSGDVQRERLATGWAVLRAMDCARCHGRALDGWAAPSLIAAVREGSRERFERMVLDGDVGRGMPGYRSVPVVVDALDAIYGYLAARADGTIAAGPPVTAAERRRMQDLAQQPQ